MKRELNFFPVKNDIPKKLRPEQITHFNEEGYIFPLDLFTEEETTANRQYFDKLMQMATDAGLHSYSINGWHRTCCGIYDLCTESRILFGQTAADVVLPAAAARDIGVLNGWSIKRGLLTGIDLSDRDQHNPEVVRATQMRQWCIEEGISLLAMALQFCLREERIHGNPLGSLNIEQLEMNARAVTEPLPPDIFERFAAQQF
jgi:hypothetical protein